MECRNCGKQTRGGYRLVYMGSHPNGLHTCKVCYNLLTKISNYGEYHNKRRAEKLARMRVLLTELTGQP